MTSLAAMMNKSADDIKEFDPPVGTWTAKLRRGKLSDPKPDKNGNEFQKANIAIELVSPGEDVDPIAANAVADQLSRGRVFYRSDLFYAGDEDKLARFLKTLRACGVQTAGRTVEEVLKDSLDGVDVMVELKRETRRNNPDVSDLVVTKIYPITG